MGVSVCQTPLDQRHDYLDECLYLYLEHVPGGSITQERASKMLQKFCDFLGQLRPDATKKSDFQTPS